MPLSVVPLLLAGLLALHCGAAAAARRLQDVGGGAWRSSIADAPAELMLPVLPPAREAQHQGDCPEGTPDLVAMPFAVAVDCLAPPAETGPAVQAASVTVEFAPGSGGAGGMTVLRPCRVHQVPQGTAGGDQGGAQVVHDSTTLHYIAFFRALPRAMCGTTPKAVITAAVDAAAPSATWRGSRGRSLLHSSTREVPVVLWGCAFLVGDAGAAAPQAPPGMPGPEMTAASADAPRPAARESNLMRL